MKSGIYRIYNNANEKMYIGQSLNVTSRLSCHKNELNKGTHMNLILAKDYKEYGEENFTFELIHSCEEEFLNIMEKYFIDKFNTTNNGYNISGGNRQIIRENKKLEKKLELERAEELKREKELEQILYIEKRNLLDRFESMYEIEITLDKLTYDSCRFYMNFLDFCYNYLEKRDEDYIDLGEERHEIIKNASDYMDKEFWSSIHDLIFNKCMEFLNEYTSVIEYKLEPDSTTGRFDNPMIYFEYYDRIFIFHITYSTFESSNSLSKEIQIILKCDE